MKKEIGIQIGGLFLVMLFVAGCASAPLPKDQKAAWKGQGKIISIVVNNEGQQEIGLVNDEGVHFSVVVKERVDLFPEQSVRVDRKAGGFGTVTAK